MSGKLNPRQAKFVAEYLKTSNATQAAIRAGYSAKTARSQGHELLTKPDIAAAVSAKVEQAAMGAAEVLEGLAGIARSAERDSDRVSAYHLLGKHHRLFVDKLEHSGLVSIQVIDPYAKAGG